MKQTTGRFKLKARKVHSIVFESVTDKDKTPATSVYLMNHCIPVGAAECKITVSFPEGGQDVDYKNVV